MGKKEKRIAPAFLIIFFALALILGGNLPDSGGQEGRKITQDRLLTDNEEIRKLYEEQSEKNDWSRADMDRALDVTRRVRSLFPLYADLYNRGVPPEVIQESFRVCRGYESAVKEYWEMIFKYHFPPREVHEVFEKLPGEIMRHYYFSYRTGGNLATRARAEGEIDPGRPGNMYSMEECLGVFLRTGSDMAVIRPYFEDRRKGLSRRQAWSNIAEKVRERKAEEEERLSKEEEKLEQDKKERLQKAEEGRRKAEELLGTDKAEAPGDEKEVKEERRRTFSLDELLGIKSEKQESLKPDKTDSEKVREQKAEEEERLGKQEDKLEPDKKERPQKAEEDRADKKDAEVRSEKDESSESREKEKDSD